MASVTALGIMYVHVGCTCVSGCLFRLREVQCAAYQTGKYAGGMAHINTSRHEWMLGVAEAGEQLKQGE